MGSWTLRPERRTETESAARAEEAPSRQPSHSRNAGEAGVPEVNREPGQSHNNTISRIFHRQVAKALLNKRARFFVQPSVIAEVVRYMRVLTGIGCVAKTKAHLAALGEQTLTPRLRERDRRPRRGHRDDDKIHAQRAETGRWRRLCAGWGRRPWKADRPGELREDKWHECALCKAGNELAWRVAQHSGLMARGLVDRATQSPGS